MFTLCFLTKFQEHQLMQLNGQRIVHAYQRRILNHSVLSFFHTVMHREAVLNHKSKWWRRERSWIQYTGWKMSLGSFTAWRIHLWFIAAQLLRQCTKLSSTNSRNTKKWSSGCRDALSMSKRHCRRRITLTDHNFFTSYTLLLVSAITFLMASLRTTMKLRGMFTILSSFWPIDGASFSWLFNATSKSWSNRD